MRQLDHHYHSSVLPHFHGSVRLPAAVTSDDRLARDARTEVFVAVAVESR